MVQKKYIIKSKKFIDNMTANIINNPNNPNNSTINNNSRADATEGITIDEIIESTGGLVTDLQPEDRLYMETVVDGEANARATTVGAIVSKTMESVEPLVDELINAGKEVLYTWDVSTDGTDIDCLNIESTFNSLIINIPNNDTSSSIYLTNFKSSNIRNIYIKTNAVEKITNEIYCNPAEGTQNIVNFYDNLRGYLGIDDTYLFYSYISRVEFYNQNFPNIKKTLYTYTLNGYSFVIKFSANKEYVTQYFNIDEYVIPYTFNPSTMELTYNPNIVIRMTQNLNIEDIGKMMNTNTALIYYDTSSNLGSYFNEISSNHLIRNNKHSGIIICAEKDFSYTEFLDKIHIFNYTYQHNSNYEDFDYNRLKVTNMYDRIFAPFFDTSDFISQTDIGGYQPLSLFPTIISKFQAKQLIDNFRAYYYTIYKNDYYRYAYTDLIINGNLYHIEKKSTRSWALPNDLINNSDKIYTPENICMQCYSNAPLHALSAFTYWDEEDDPVLSSNMF